jgi:hypothetical protein
MRSRLGDYHLISIRIYYEVRIMRDDDDLSLALSINE